jgi:hypothetical protein
MRAVRSSVIRLPLTFHDTTFTLIFRASVYSFLRRRICRCTQSLLSPILLDELLEVLCVDSVGDGGGSLDAVAPITV